MIENNFEGNCGKSSPKEQSQTLIEDSEEEFDFNEVEDYSMFEEHVEEEKNDIYELPLFDGQARMTARALFPAKRFDIWAEVSTVCRKGALLSASGTRDHIWLGFVDDRAVLRWDAGSGPFELHTGKVKTEGKSKISARRYKKDAVLKLGSSVARGSSHGRMTSLDVDPYIYIGHPPDNVTKLASFLMFLLLPLSFVSSVSYDLLVQVIRCDRDTWLRGLRSPVARQWP